MLVHQSGNPTEVLFKYLECLVQGPLGHNRKRVDQRLRIGVSEL